MMEHHRKCDTDKYRRRRKHDKAAHAEHVARRREADELLRRLSRDRRDRETAELHQLRTVRQRLVNVLAGELYRRDPEEAQMANLCGVLAVLRRFGGARLPLSIDVRRFYDDPQRDLR